MIRFASPWKFSIRVLVVLGMAGLTFAKGPDTPATITSDELELQNNGALTIFQGHVVLTQGPYEVRSDRIVRTKADGRVDARGHVVGSWVSPKKEKVRIVSEEAAYDPSKETVELWGKTQVAVYLQSVSGQAEFRADRGWIYTKTPGKARLTGHVRGHVTPGST